ncbi:Phosphatidylethanolamine-binding protein PEBP [Akanthomyces lecanii RCEF 1005]|uniref:Phosphatidylethanolamine-binding protein PEBP n=1 Tax=Akanthomyces lecanii RCEF 1005 TaxID=1081108 RepID=A0A168HJ56_CORDF|nr:Phosphatidylethanolamine-binding protein PEBP [Akanthomyces lecanii RCEF 1005]
MKACPSVLTALERLDASPDKTSQLRIVFPGNTAISSVGIKLSKLATKDAPTISVSTSLVKPHDGDKYIAMCIDLDAPFVSFSFLGPITHWLQTDLVAAKDSSQDGFTTLETETRSIFPYAGPGPPPPSAPHRYVFMLWEQPASVASADEVAQALSVPAEPGLTARVRWDQPWFEQKMGLGEPLAVNYFVANSE